MVREAEEKKKKKKKTRNGKPINKQIAYVLHAHSITRTSFNVSLATSIVPSQLSPYDSRDSRLAKLYRL